MAANFILARASHRAFSTLARAAEELGFDDRKTPWWLQGTRVDRCRERVELSFDAVVGFRKPDGNTFVAFSFREAFPLRTALRGLRSRSADFAKAFLIEDSAAKRWTARWPEELRQQFGLLQNYTFLFENAQLIATRDGERVPRPKEEVGALLELARRIVEHAEAVFSPLPARDEKKDELAALAKQDSEGRSDGNAKIEPDAPDWSVGGALTYGFLTGGIAAAIWGLFGGQLGWLDRIAAPIVVGLVCASSDPRDRRRASMCGTLVTLWLLYVIDSVTYASVAWRQLGQLPYSFWRPTWFWGYFFDTLTIGTVVSTGLSVLAGGLLAGRPSKRKAPPSGLSLNHAEFSENAPDFRGAHPAHWLVPSGPVAVTVLLTLATLLGVAVCCWDSATGHRPVVAFSPRDGQLVIDVGDSIARWDLIAGEERRTRGTLDAKSLAWAPTRNRLAVACEGSAKLVWAQKLSRPMRLTLPDEKENAFDVAISRDERLLAARTERGIVHRLAVWDLETHDVRAGFAAGAHVTTCVPGLVGESFLIGTALGEVVVFSLSGERTAEWRAHGRAVSALAFSQDGERLVTAGGVDAKVKVWSHPSAELEREIGTEYDWVTDVAVSSDDRLLAIAGGTFLRKGGVTVYGLEDGQLLLRLESDFDTVGRVTFYDGDAKVAGVTHPKISMFDREPPTEIERWTVETGERLERLR